MNQIEFIKALYQSEYLNSAPVAGEHLFRANIGAGRHYRRENGRLYKSLTTFLSEVEPKNRFLQSWRESMVEEMGSKEAVDSFVNSTAEYGSLLHILVADFVRNGQVEWADVSSFAADYLLSDPNFKEESLFRALEEIRRDLAAILQFFHDYEVEVLAVELPVWLEPWGNDPEKAFTMIDKMGLATCIDLYVVMNEKAYTEKTPPDMRKRTRAIGNLKSGKKGFWNTHVLQLIGERKMFNEIYGSVLLPVETVFNLSPKDWTSYPSYEFKNQTKEANAKEAVFSALELVALESGLLNIPEKKFFLFEGVTKFGESPTLAIKTISYEEYLNKKITVAEQAVADEILKDVKALEDAKALKREALDFPDDRYFFLHNLEDFGLHLHSAFVNWLARTSDPTDRLDFMQYVVSKDPENLICLLVTEEDYTSGPNVNQKEEAL